MNKLTIEVSDNELVVSAVLSDLTRIYAVLNPKDADIIDRVNSYLIKLLDERKTRVS